MPRLTPIALLAAAAVVTGSLAVLLLLGGSAGGSPTASGQSPSAGSGPTSTPAASLVAAGSPTASPSAAPTAAPSPDYRDPVRLQPGDCFDPLSDAATGAFLAAAVVPCSAPHAAELFGRPTLPDGPAVPYPGDDEVGRASEDLCYVAFETYLGISFDDSVYGVTYYTPTAESWPGGDRLVLCTVDNYGKPIEGSLRGAGR